MSASPCLDTERWLCNQNHIIVNLFTRATEELQALGVRVLTGSHSPRFNATDKELRIQLTPLRFTTEANNEALSLGISASTRGGPPRYVVALELHGEGVVEALRRLSADNQDCWQKLYVQRGLWLDGPEGTRLLNDVSKISASNAQNLRLSCVFSHSALTNSVQAGLIVMGVLYRSVLDELSDASKFRNLTAQIEESLGGHYPQFQSSIRP